MSDQPHRSQDQPFLPVRWHAPAKLNLGLFVGAPADDGLHPLATWMCTVGLFDMLSIERLPDGLAPPADGLPRLAPVTWEPGSAPDASDVPNDQRNLVSRAATALLTETARTAPGLQVNLTKSIPSGAGLGGGSSDAATTLLALHDLLRLQLDRGQLRRIAGKIGADVAFFLDAPSAICTGRGERVEPVPSPKPGWALLIMPRDIALPTPAVYRRFDERNVFRSTISLQTAASEWRGWVGLRAKELMGRLVNDLEAAAFDLSPVLGGMRDGMERALRRPVRMSGSGSALFTLYDDQTEAAEAGKTAADSVGSRVRTEVVVMAPEASRAVSRQ
jgi:4-diphosphocytidyl-2-C-methyl-D-erythritol kinase